MSAQALDDIASIEASAAVIRARLKLVASEVVTRARPAAIGSVMAEKLNLQTSDIARNVRGYSARWAAGIVGAGLVFELGRWSKSKAASIPSAHDTDAAIDSGAEGPMPASNTNAPGVPSSSPLKTLVLAAMGLGGGYVVSALLPNSALESKIRGLVSEKFQDQARSFVTDNRTGLYKLAFNASGLPRYLAGALMVISLVAGSWPQQSMNTGREE